MVRPLGQPLARRAVTLEDLREEFLVHCETRNLSGRTLEWYSTAPAGSRIGAPPGGSKPPPTSGGQTLRSSCWIADTKGSLPTPCTATPNQLSRPASPEASPPLSIPLCGSSPACS